MYCSPRVDGGILVYSHPTPLRVTYGMVEYWSIPMPSHRSGLRAAWWNAGLFPSGPVPAAVWWNTGLFPSHPFAGHVTRGRWWNTGLFPALALRVAPTARWNTGLFPCRPLGCVQQLFAGLHRLEGLCPYCVTGGWNTGLFPSRDAVCIAFRILALLPGKQRRARHGPMLRRQHCPK